MLMDVLIAYLNVTNAAKGKSYSFSHPDQNVSGVIDTTQLLILLDFVLTIN